MARPAAMLALVLGVALAAAVSAQPCIPCSACMTSHCWQLCQPSCSYAPITPDNVIVSGDVCKRAGRDYGPTAAQVWRRVRPPLLLYWGTRLSGSYPAPRKVCRMRLDAPGRTARRAASISRAPPPRARPHLTRPHLTPPTPTCATRSARSLLAPQPSSTVTAGTSSSNRPSGPSAPSRSRSAPTSPCGSCQSAAGSTWLSPCGWQLASGYGQCSADQFRQFYNGETQSLCRSFARTVTDVDPGSNSWAGSAAPLGGGNRRLLAARKA
jgi:hypothetical protein